MFPQVSGALREMMPGSEKTSVRITLKIFNSAMAMVGMPMVLYGAWMLLAWQRENADASETTYDFNDLWFVYSVIFIGMTFCLVTCLGHFSANSSDRLSLNCYSAITGILVFMEILVVADVLLDSDWEHSLPEDPTGWFHDFEHYIDTNISIFQWIGLFMVIAQAISITLALALKTFDTEPEPPYIDYPPTSFPLIYHNFDSVYAVDDPGFKYKNDPWKAEK